MEKQTNKEVFYSGLVWVVSGAALTIYGIMGLLDMNVIGVEELVSLISSANGDYIYAVAFISIFLEGLYIVGSFIPGATMVLIVAILSQVGGVVVFILTIVSIFVGWSLAGMVNITLAKTYHLKIVGSGYNPDYQIEGRPWTTWFPAFRANYEVAQVTEGGEPYRVLLSSIKVKFLVSMIAACCTLIIPLFIDVHEISNDEGFVSVAVVAIISFIVGGIKLHKYWSDC